MRDHLLNIEHKVVENVYTSIKDLRELKEEGKTIILTTHFLDEADSLCDRVGVMNKGKLFILGSAGYIKKTFG